MEAGVGDEAAAERAGRVGGAVPGQAPQTRLTEDVSAGQAAARPEENVQAHGAGQAVPVHVLTGRRTGRGRLGLRQHRSEVTQRRREN